VDNVKNSKILVVGDGNMTFSQSLASKLTKPKHLFATTFLTREELIKAYGEKKMSKLFN
tara:strand:+ start:557 stop:733 length:177 start_codon:yes stop_codon:yes gene_type:complete